MLKQFRKYLFLLTLVVVFTSCSKDDSEAAADLVTISEITNITDLTATLSGAVQAPSGTTITAKGFVWGLSPSPTVEFSKISDEGNGSGNFSSAIEFLSRNTEYFVRAYATTSEGITYSEERSFTTTNDCPNGIYRGSVTLLNQDMVDEFGSFQYCEVEGSLRISSFGNEPILTDLRPLRSITKVGSLDIDNNFLLTSLEGLNSITETRSLVVAYNTELTNIDALQNITSPIVRMLIRSNEKLQNLDGLSGLTELDAEIIAMELRDNPAITNIDGLSNVTSVRGRIDIGYNNLLQNLNGFENVVNFDGSLDIYSNTSLTNINGLSSAERIENLYISNNLELTNLDGLQSLRTVEESVALFSNGSIASIRGLSSLETVGESFSLLFSNDLQSLDGLENLVSVMSITVSGNETLADFCALENLINNGEAIDEYTVQGNLYNPTQQDIMDGNCSQ